MVAATTAGAAAFGVAALFFGGFAGGCAAALFLPGAVEAFFGFSAAVFPLVAGETAFFGAARSLAGDARARVTCCAASSLAGARAAFGAFGALAGAFAVGAGSAVALGFLGDARVLAPEASSSADGRYGLARSPAMSRSSCGRACAASQGDLRVGAPAHAERPNPHWHAQQQQRDTQRTRRTRFIHSTHANTRVQCTIHETPGSSLLNITAQVRVWQRNARQLSELRP